MTWNPGPSGVLIGLLQIVLALMLVRARLHVIPANADWPRVRERDGVRKSMVVLIAFTLLLGVMRATGLDFLLSGEGRLLAFREDWYQSRSALQVPLLTLVGLLYLGAMLTLRHVRFSGPKARAGFGIAALIAVLHVEMLRMVSLHATDAILYLHLGVATLGTLFELAMIGIAYACLVPLALRRGHPGEGGR